MKENREQNLDTCDLLIERRLVFTDARSHLGETG
jgi:hypothetical protein